MCFYCGCRELPLIRDFIAEHEAVTDLAEPAREALIAGRADEARALLEDLRPVLLRHWKGEENGLFAVMRRYDEYRDYVASLEDEHQELDLVLRTCDPDLPEDRARLVAAIEALWDHLAKEEDGLFPASLTALSGEEWDEAIRAWQASADPAHVSNGRIR